MKDAVWTIAVFLAVFASTARDGCDGADDLVFGRDRMLFTNERAVTPRVEQARIARQFEARVPIPAGRPFRNGVEVCGTMPGSETYPFVRLNAVYGSLSYSLSYGNLDSFIATIESEHDFKAVLSRIQNVGAEDWLSPRRFRSVLMAVEAAPRELGFQILSKDFEADLLAAGVFRRGDVWLADLVVRDGASIVELKYAIDGKIRLAYRRRALVEGPKLWPMDYPGSVEVASGALILDPETRVFRGPKTPGQERKICVAQVRPPPDGGRKAFDEAVKFLQTAIDASRNGGKP